MTTEIQRLQNEITAAESKHNAYRDKVRSEVLTQHFEGSWCLPGTQDVLADLNLRPITMAYQGYASLRVVITNVADATSLEEAEARVAEALDIVNSDPSVTITFDGVAPRLDEKQHDDR
jgi:hypothetical protein